MLKRGELTIALSPIAPAGMKTRWEYIVMHGERVLCEGEDLETIQDEEGTACELISFMVLLDSEARKEYGWDFTGEEIEELVESDWNCEDGDQYLIEEV